MGIDPGLINTGYGIVDASGKNVCLVEAGLIRTASDTALEIRLKEIYKGITSVIRDYNPSIAVVEDLYTNYRYPRTAVLMGHARGVIFLAASYGDLTVISYPPARVKKALVGTGRAGKAQIQRMVQIRLGLDKVPEPNHIADALALALCHYDCLAHNFGHEFTGRI
ncbi:MAG: crossover junction endodeoxyribonuclease RuvC [Firmicutes bacterium]|nr:crossover junction endodeoxyribonuclease RuvC [Bacillota bacterium]